MESIKQNQSGFITSVNGIESVNGGALKPLNFIVEQVDATVETQPSTQSDMN